MGKYCRALTLGKKYSIYCIALFHDHNNAQSALHGGLLNIPIPSRFHGKHTVRYDISHSNHILQF